MLVAYRLAQLYAALGGLVAIGFLGFGIDRVSPGAHGSHAFRPLLLPGLILLWPLVLWRWHALSRPQPAMAGFGREYRSAHRAIWLALAMLLPLLLALAMALRQDDRADAPAQLLAPPGAAP